MSKDQAANGADTSARDKRTLRIFMTPEERMMKRVRRKPFGVLLAPEEREKIESSATAKGLSASAYLRTLGLGYEPRPVLDAEQVDGLLKLGTDLVRLSELLKLWLNEQPGRGVSVIDVQRLFAQTMETRAEIADKVMEMQVLTKG
jgi:hypothetical protein